MGVVGKRFFNRSFFNHSFFDRSRGKRRSGSKLRASAKAVVPLISVFALGACAIHPVQQNVTGLPVVGIVNHIRCETRAAIQRTALLELRRYAHKYHHDESPLADKLEHDPGIGKPWPPGRYLPALDKAELAFYSRYIQTGIAYTFTFDITEDNKAALAADPVRLITNGMAGVGLSSSGEFSRENSRTFIVSETFQKLLQNNIVGCGEEPPPSENFAYPIAGSINMYEMISTFIDLNEDETLVLPSGNSEPSSNTTSGAPSNGSGTSPKSATSKSTKAPSGGSTSGSGVFSDQLNFTTTLMGGVTPSIQINPVGRQWGLASPTNLAATVTRTDKHNLQIGLSLATPGESATQTAAEIASFTGVRPAVLVTSGRLAPSALQKHRSMVSPAEQRALDAMTQQRIDNFLNRFGTLGPTQ